MESVPLYLRSRKATESRERRVTCCLLTTVGLLRTRGYVVACSKLPFFPPPSVPQPGSSMFHLGIKFFFFPRRSISYLTAVRWRKTVLTASGMGKTCSACLLNHRPWLSEPKKKMGVVWGKEKGGRDTQKRAK